MTRVPRPDACVFAGTPAARGSRARGRVGSRLARPAAGLLGAPPALYGRPVRSGLVHGVHLVPVILGMRAWWRRGRAAAHPAEPVQLEGAGA